jgi:MerR family transcriptional regulator, thiopeptide resistance regulator
MSVQWRIGEVARLARVSVRTLHHYDVVGLLPPSGRSAAGYRLYTAPDLERLQQILLFRELGFALAEIRRIMLDPEFDRRRALTAQRTLLAARARRLGAMLSAVDDALDALQKGITMEADDLFEVFGDFDPRDYDDEVQRRWGGTDAYVESARRTAAYGKADWQAIKAENDEITAAFVAALDQGLAPDDPAVQALVDRHWHHLARWFYTPTSEMYAGLGDLYVNDSRFTRNIDKAREGLAAYQRAAMRSYAQAGPHD